MKSLVKKSLEKLPPFDLGAEQAVLGAILLDNNALFTALEHFHPTDFYRASHQHIFEAMLALDERGSVIDLLTLRDDLERQINPISNKSILEECGGAAYLMKLVDAVPTAANVAYHARIIKDLANKRHLLNAAIRIATSMYNNEPIEEALDILQSETQCLRSSVPLSWVRMRDGKPAGINDREFARFLESLGYCNTIYNKALLYVENANGIVTELEQVKFNICYEVKQRLKLIYETEAPSLWNLILKHKPYDHHVMTSLRAIPQEEFIRDSKDMCHLYFQNGIVTVTPETVFHTPYHAVKGYVWSESITPNNYEGIHAGRPAYDPDEDRPAEFERFVRHIADEVVDGHEVRNKVVFEDGLARTCWHHFDPLNPRSIVIIDNNPSEFSDGRRGKGILLEGLRRIRSNGTPDGVVIREDGKSFGGQFKFQRVKANTKILIIDDVDEKTVSFDSFFSAITEGLVKEGKGMTRCAFTPETSPKLVFTTNHVFFGVDRSSADRMTILPLTEFFTHKDNRPVNVFGHRLFYDWDNAEWARFHDYFIRIIQEAMRRDPKDIPQTDLTTFNAARLTLEVSDVICNYMDQLADDQDYLQEQIQKDFEGYGITFKKRGEFRRTLETYARLRGRTLIKNKDGRYRKNSVDYVRFAATCQYSLPSDSNSNQEQVF